MLLSLQAMEKLKTEYGLMLFCAAESFDSAAFFLVTLVCLKWIEKRYSLASSFPKSLFRRMLIFAL